MLYCFIDDNMNHNLNVIFHKKKTHLIYLDISNDQNPALFKNVYKL